MSKSSVTNKTITSTQFSKVTFNNNNIHEVIKNDQIDILHKETHIEVKLKISSPDS